jgi:hypothetical protein
MKHCVGSRNRFVAVVMLSLLALTQVGCASLQVSGSLAPGPDDPGTPGSRSGVATGSSTGAVVGYVTLGVVAGYLVYKLFIDNSRNEDGTSDAAAIAVQSGGSPADSIGSPSSESRPAAPPGGS